MHVLKFLVDNVGDLLGTSRLAKLNRQLFRPVLGTSITREEYNMCDGPETFEGLGEINPMQFKGMNMYDKSALTNQVLDTMVENGTVFRDHRIVTLASKQNNFPGHTALTYSVRDQLSTEGQANLKRSLKYQR